MRNLTRAPRCARCALHPHLCVCAALQPVSLPFELVVVRHWQEALKPTGSAALLALCVDGTRILDYGARHTVFVDDGLSGDGAYLLLPPEPIPADPPPPPPDLRRLVLVDGTWAQARRLAARAAGLPTMPRWWLTRPARVTARLRNPHEPWARSTFEAAAEAVGALVDPQLEASLLGAYDLWVDRALQMRGVGRPPGGP